jgi:hypothetical protein
MNIALVLQHKLLLGIQRMMSGTPAPERKTAYWPPKHALPLKTIGANVPRQDETLTARANGLNTKKIMPLRVLRVVEKGQPRSSTGRLVISGRMADVCAELDRLVARESALH